MKEPEYIKGPEEHENVKTPATAILQALPKKQKQQSEGDYAWPWLRLPFCGRGRESRTVSVFNRKCYVNYGSLLGSAKVRPSQYNLAAKETNMKAFLVVAMLIMGPIACQRSISAQQPKPDYSHVKKDIMGESVALFLANNPGCRFDLPEETFPVSGSKMCVVVDREHMKGKPAQITYAGMPVQVQSHFYNDALFYLEFMTIGPDDCQTYHILDRLKEKYGAPKETHTVHGKEVRPAEFSEKHPFLFWQNGTITITYSDALSCSVSFEVDNAVEAVTRAMDAADTEKHR